MSDYATQLALFEQNIKWLNGILLGGVDHTEMIEGVVKPSVSKDIEDRFAAVQSAIVGRVSFELKSGLIASGAPVADSNGYFPLAEVWNDGVDANNGTYGWDGAAWVKSPYDLLSKVNSLSENLLTISLVNFLSQPEVVVHSSAGEKFPWSIVVNDKIVAGYNADKDGFYIHNLLFPDFFPIFDEDRLPLISTNDHQLMWMNPDFSLGANIRFSDKGFGCDSNGRYPLLTTNNGVMQWLSDGVVRSSEKPLVSYCEDVLGVNQVWAVTAGARKQVSFSQTQCNASASSGYVHIASSDSVWLIDADNIASDSSDKWAMIVGMGQSLSAGFDSSGEVLTVNPVASHIKSFNGGVFPAQFDPISSTKGDVIAASQLASIVDANEFRNGTNNYESHLTAMACALSVAADVGEQILVSGHGHGSSAYNTLEKGTTPYSNAMAGVTSHASLAASAGKSTCVPYVDWVHGEADRTRSKEVYEGYLSELATDLNDDIKAITSQSEDVYLVTDQIGSEDSGVVSGVALAALEAAKNNPHIFCCGPKYMLDFSDGTHLVSSDYQKLGEYHAKFAADQIAGRGPLPLHLTEVERVSEGLNLKFHVPVKPLQLGGEGIVSDPGDSGISAVQSGVALIISDIKVISDDAIFVKCAYDSQAITVSIAMQGLQTQGPLSGPRSLIHDSDQRVGVYTGTQLINWCCHSQAIG